VPVRKKVPIVTDALREWTQPVAQIVGPHGLKGAVKVRPLHGGAYQLFFAGNQLCLALPSGRRQLLTIQTCYERRGIWIVKFAEMEHIGVVKQCIGLFLTVPKGWRPKLQEGEFLLSDLLGMTVVTEEGEVVGEVLDITENPAYDVLVTERGMIPMVRDFVKRVDLKRRQIVVSLPQGLLSEEVPKKRRPRWRR